MGIKIFPGPETCLLITACCCPFVHRSSPVACLVAHFKIFTEGKQLPPTHRVYALKLFAPLTVIYKSKGPQEQEHMHIAHIQMRCGHATDHTIDTFNKHPQQPLNAACTQEHTHTPKLSPSTPLQPLCCLLAATLGTCARTSAVLSSISHSSTAIPWLGFMVSQLFISSH